MSIRIALSSLVTLACLMSSSPTNAQWSDEFATRSGSSAWMRADIRVGQYLTDLPGFDTYFGSDGGPLLTLELDVLPLRIPYVGRVGAGLAWGWARFERGTCTDTSCRNRTNGEDTELRLFPLSALAVLEIDVLARELNIPLVFMAKLGLDNVFYRIRPEETSKRGRSMGLRWAAQVALELDFINRRRAASLDEFYGINHTYVVGEIFGSTAGNASGGGLPVGTDVSWTVGLGLSF